MKIADKDNSLGITIARYEFSNASSDFYASNWLIVQLLISDKKGSWIVESSCLLTSEVSQLADWFDQISDGNFQTDQISFLEPTISFSTHDSNEGTILRLHLSNEIFPVWAVEQDEYFIDFTASTIDLRSAAENLRKQLERYPQRAVA